MRELLLLFGRLGLTSFGGPAAHIAMMETEFVDRRGWLPRQQFLDLLGATNLIPGPNSTELAMHLGYLRRGQRGLVVAGLAFMLPAVVITVLLAWSYVRFGQLPALQAPIAGARAALIAVIVGTVIRLARSALKGSALVVVGLLVLAGSAVGLGELTLLLLGGAIGATWTAGLPRVSDGAPALLPLTFLVPATSMAGPTLLPLGGFFFKIGATLYGSGYVLIAFLQRGLVADRGWLTPGQLVDAVATGQLTPGPVFSTAAFVGFQLLGIPGALVATVGIFLPSFVFVALTAPHLDRLRRSPWLSAFLDAVNVASLALILAVAARLGRDTLDGIGPIGIALAGGIVVALTRVNLTWVVLGGGLLGWILLR